jgi:hypothetical protein
MWTRSGEFDTAQLASAPLAIAIDLASATSTRSVRNRNCVLAICLLGGVAQKAFVPDKLLILLARPRGYDGDARKGP